MSKTPKAKQKYGHTTMFQLRAMVDWLEVPENFKIIKGESTKGKSFGHGVAVTKIKGYGLMAAHVYKSARRLAKAEGVIDERHAHQWTAGVCQSRWKSHYKRYIKVRDRVQKQTGYGITSEMMAAGLTLEDVIERECPFYRRIDAIFGQQSNVQPASVMAEPALSDNEGQADYSFDAHVDTSDDGGGSDAELGLLAQLDTSGLQDSDSDRASTSSAPVLASRADLPADATADQKGVDKANEAKRRDFSSAYVERASKRLQSEEKRFKAEMAWRQKQHEQEMEFRTEELKLKSQEQKYRVIEKREEGRNKLVLQLLQSGMPVDQVKATVNAFFPQTEDEKDL
ncbi:hypothetical protein P43SY_011014 [Pythium insidiosum]|uniref:Uncharacterized protein n=1 Tax=Pythium insidiosum TaxID=114742 RepID=A0AAD5Q5D3_PYTIN|nr:hypothetical protein P43SY_011014 [Pythium insidiosum]